MRCMVNAPQLSLATIGLAHDPSHHSFAHVHTIDIQCKKTEKYTSQLQLPAYAYGLSYLVDIPTQRPIKVLQLLLLILIS